MNNNDISAVLDERGNRYGKFKDLAVIEQSLKSVMRESPSWNDMQAHHRVALEMIQHKISRILNGDPTYADNWTDIAGYASLAKERHE